jgi:hypothetical protein
MDGWASGRKRKKRLAVPVSRDAVAATTQPPPSRGVGRLNVVARSSTRKGLRVLWNATEVVLCPRKGGGGRDRPGGVKGADDIY